MIINHYFRLSTIQLRYVLNCILYRKQNKNANVSCIIFSRNRAFQLDALLESLQLYSHSKIQYIVQYSCSENHAQSYQELINRYLGQDICFIKESDFRNTLINIIRTVKTKYLFFLVDDQVFIKSFKIEDLTGKIQKHTFASLRLGKNITNWGIKDVKLSPQYIEKDNTLEWKWLLNKNQHDWGYQFSVDGTIYLTIDILRCIKSIPFKAPNSFEANMNSVILFKRNNFGISFLTPVVVNLIINASRIEDNYNDCVSGEYSTEDLLDLWNKGKKLDVKKISSMKFSSTHHIINNIDSIITNT